MKLENLTFSQKGSYGNRYLYTVPSVRISLYCQGKRQSVVVSFYNCDNLYKSNTYCRYAIAGNRLYFMYCVKSESAYALSKLSKTSKNRKFQVMYNKELSKFVRSGVYTPKLDNECGLWYIEY